jgi:hypothetical protein
MKTKSLLVMMMAGFLLFSGNVLAERPPGVGGGGGGGGGDVETPDLGDLLILYRNVDGVPYLTEDSCWQPLPTEDCVDIAPDCPLVPSDPDEPGVYVIWVDPDTCAVPPACALCTQEVEFGRINEARSPDTVFDSQLDDVLVNLGSAGCVSLDPAGRLATSTAVYNPTTLDIDYYLSGAIDSPLQNLAIYRQLMMTGSLGIPVLEEAGAPLEDPLIAAARALGAAADKTGEVNVDMVTYLNQIMGLAEEGGPSILDKNCIDIKEEVSGVVKMVRKCFLDYSAYDYDRAENFGALPAPAYIPEGSPLPGTFEYLYVMSPTAPTFGKAQGPILDGVFCVDGDGNPVIPMNSTGICYDDIALGYTEGNIGGFAQAADDTRAVIDFMHTWPLPEVFATELTCDVAASGADVLISEESGLQVPTQMVDGSEGRELIVTVTNAGPQAATGTVTVNVEGVNAANIFGVTLEGGIYVPDYDDNPEWSFDFALPPGLSQSFVKLFSIDFGERTTITWTATAAVDSPNDLNTDNNSVTTITNVKVTGGGGGGH